MEQLLLMNQANQNWLSSNWFCEGWRSGLFEVCQQMSEPKFVQDFWKRIELKLCELDNANQVQNIKLVELKFDGKGQRASYKLDAGQRT